MYPCNFPLVTGSLENHKFPSSADEYYDLDLGRNLTASEYKMVESFYKQRCCSSLKDYGTYYLAFRVDGINAVTQSLNNWALTNYRLSIHHDMTLAGFSWCALMLHTGAKFQYLKSARITELILDNLVAGISHLSKRHIVAQTPRLDHNVTDNSKRVELLSADVKSAYAFSMTMKTPIGDYELLKGEAVDRLNILELDSDGQVGYFVNVDLLYPPDIKAGSLDFPYVPVKGHIEVSELAEHHQDLYRQMHSSSSIETVLLTQHDKKGVLLHHKMLCWYVNCGMKVAKVNYLIRFRQECWMKPFVNFTASIRNTSTSSLEKQLSKLVLNLCYGKMYGGYQSISIRFCNNQNRAMGLSGKEDF